MEAEAQVIGRERQATDDIAAPRDESAVVEKRPLATRSPNELGEVRLVRSRELRLAERAATPTRRSPDVDAVVVVAVLAARCWASDLRRYEQCAAIRRPRPTVDRALAPACPVRGARAYDASRCRDDQNDALPRAACAPERDRDYGVAVATGESLRILAYGKIRAGTKAGYLLEVVPRCQPPQGGAGEQVDAVCAGDSEATVVKEHGSGRAHPPQRRAVAIEQDDPRTRRHRDRPPVRRPAEAAYPFACGGSPEQSRLALCGKDDIDAAVLTRPKPAERAREEGGRRKRAPPREPGGGAPDSVGTLLHRPFGARPFCVSATARGRE